LDPITPKGDPPSFNPLGIDLEAVYKESSKVHNKEFLKFEQEKKQREKSIGQLN